MDFLESQHNSSVGQVELKNFLHEQDQIPSTWSWSISIEKLTAMAVLTLTSIIFGLFPYILFSYYRRVIRTDSTFCKIILAALSSVSGGVLLATTMLHILPEVREKAEAKQDYFDALLSRSGFKIPVAEMLMLYGFCLIYGLEEIAQFLAKLDFSCRFQRSSNNPLRQDSHHHHHHHNPEFGTKIELDCKKDPECPHEELLPSCNSDTSSRSRDQGTGTAQTLTMAQLESPSFLAPMPPSQLRGSLFTLNNIEDDSSPSLGALRSLVSLIALSFHAIMEGIAVGVQDPSDLWMTFGAIASHKCIIALCLGMEMMKSNINWKTLVASIMLFSIVSPLGILIGSVMVSGDVASSGWVVIVEGLACGTLVYIIFFEILPPEHDHNDFKTSATNSEGSEYSSTTSRSGPKMHYQGILRFFGTLVGITIAGYILSLTAHSHNHSHSHSHSYDNLVQNLEGEDGVAEHLHNHSLEHD